MKKHFSLKAIPLIMLVVLLITTLSACQNYATDADVVLSNLDIDIVINRDGSATFTEEWTAKFDDRGSAYNNLYKTFVNRDANFDVNSEIKDVSVYDQDNDIDYNYQSLDVYNPDQIASSRLINAWYTYKDTSSNSTELGLVMPKLFKGTRKFLIKYTLTNIAVKHADVVDFQYPIVGATFSLPITNYSAKISVEGGVYQDLRTWFHIDSFSTSDSKVEDDGIVYMATNIPPKTIIESRVILDISNFDNLEKSTSYAMKQIIIDQEQKLFEDYQNKVKIEKIKLYTSIVASILILLGMIVAIYIAHKKNQRIKVEIEYYRETFPEYAAAELGQMFYYYKGGIKDSNRSNLMASAILSLARKGYLTMDAKDKEIQINLTESYDKKPLYQCEETILELLKSQNRESFTMKDLNDFTKVNYVHVNTLMSKFTSQITAKFRAGKYIKPLSSFIGFLMSASVLLFLLGAACFVLGFLNPIASITLSASGILGIILTPKLPTLTMSGETLNAELHGLKKFLLDFTNMKEYGVLHLELWEDYMILATMMGISSEVVKILKSCYKEFQQIETAYDPSRGFLFTYMYLNHRMYHGGGGMSFDIGSSISGSFSSLSKTIQTVQASKSSSSSGGGFGGGGFGGGGGGGFGGGGGGGAR